MYAIRRNAKQIMFLQIQKKELLVKLTAPDQGISKGKGERLRNLNEFWLMPTPSIDGIISFIQS